MNVLEYLTPRGPFVDYFGTVWMCGAAMDVYAKNTGVYWAVKI